MKKLSIILVLSLMAILVGATPGGAHGSKRHPSVKHAARELREAKEILGKLSPDTDGHIAKASQNVDQAIQELSAVESAPKTEPAKPQS